MKKQLFYIFFVAITLNSCDFQKSSKSDPILNTQQIDSTNNFELKGTWIRFDKYGFSLIEIKDSLNITYTELEDRKAAIDTIISDRYWYYKSSAKMGFWNSLEIWIRTDKFRFDYKIKGDTLIEFDKMGDQGKYIKMTKDVE